MFIFFVYVIYYCIIDCGDVIFIFDVRCVNKFFFGLVLNILGCGFFFNLKLLYVYLCNNKFSMYNLFV